MPWADQALVKNEIDLKMLILLGPKTKDDLRPKTKNKNGLENIKTKDKRSKNFDKFGMFGETQQNQIDTIEDLLRNSTQIHKVGENYKTDGYIITDNTMQLLKEHVKAVDGKVTNIFYYFIINQKKFFLNIFGARRKKIIFKLNFINNLIFLSFF